MTLDELFEILDCYVEEYHWSLDPLSWRPYKYTTGSTSSNESLNDQINKLTTDKITTVTYGSNSTSYGSSDLQLTTSH